MDFLERHGQKDWRVQEGRKVETEMQEKATMEKVDNRMRIVNNDLTEHEDVQLVDRI
jgi:hypothetical protein